MAITPKQIKNTISMVKNLFSSGEQQVAQNLDNPHSVDNISFDDVSEGFLQLYPQNTPPTDIPTINNPILGGSPLEQFNVPPPFNFPFEPIIHLPSIPPLKTNDSFIPFSGFNPTVSNFDNPVFNSSPPLIFNVSDPSQPPQAFPGKEALDESSKFIKNLLSSLDNNQAPPTHPISIPELTVTPSPITTTPQPTPVAELPLKAPETTPAVTQPVSQPIMAPPEAPKIAQPEPAAVQQPQANQAKQLDEHPDSAYLNDQEMLDIKRYNNLEKALHEADTSGSKNLRPEDRDLLMMTSPSEIIKKARERGVFRDDYNPTLTPPPKEEIPSNPVNESIDDFLTAQQGKGDEIDGLSENSRFFEPSKPHSEPRKPGELKKLNEPKPEPPAPVRAPTEKELAYEARTKSNPNFAKLSRIENFEPLNDSGSVSSLAFDKAVNGKNSREVQMLKHELIGEARNNNPETVNQRIDFYKSQGTIDDKEAEPLKAFFNTNFENMDEAGMQGWFNQYQNNLNNKMTPRQARLSVNQQMDNKREGFFSAGSEDNFKNFAGRALIGGAFGAAIGTATDDNPEAGFVAGVVGATAGKNIAGMLRNNTDMFEGKMINSLLKDTAKGKTRAQQLEAVDDLDDEALDFMDKMYKDKLTNNFGTANMFESSALTSSRNMTLGGAALAGVAFTPKKRDHRRGFNANRGNRI